MTTREQPQQEQPTGRAYENAGAMWERKTRKGDAYLSGYLELADGSRIAFTAFRNGYKQSTADQAKPDWVLFVPTPEPPTDPEEHPW